MSKDNFASESDTAPLEVAEQGEDKQQSGEVQESFQPPAPVTATKPTSKIVKMTGRWGLFVGAIILFGALSAFAVWMQQSRTEREKAELSSKTSGPKGEEGSSLGVAAGLLEGSVEYSSDGGDTWKKLSEGVDLKEGDSVRTLNDGRATLLVDDGSAVRLSSNTSVRLKTLNVKQVEIINTSGEVYSRVTASNSRKFVVLVDDNTYTAKGTAYRTTNSPSKKGVEVFHSQVTTSDKDIAEGSFYFTLLDDKEKQNVVSIIDLVALKKDEFIKWNGAQDKKEAEFAGKLGVLAELDKPDVVPVEPSPKPTTVTVKPSQNPPLAATGIVLYGSVSDYSAVFSWNSTGVDVSKGYKLVKSKVSQSPVYPADSVAYIEAGKSSYSLYLGDGKTYYFRLCAYTGSGCVSYSNYITITTPLKPKLVVESGAVNMSISGDSASWTFAGTAPYGFKLVMSSTPAPTYQNAPFKKFTDGNSTDLPEGLTSGTTYYARVCKYTEGDCVDYSNELTYLAP